MNKVSSKLLSQFQKHLGFLCTANIDANDLAFNKKKELLPLEVPAFPAWCGQSHKDLIYIASKEKQFDKEADAIITQEKNLPLLIRTADCLAIFVYDPVTQTIANIHAGWKSQSLQIVTKTLQRMEKEFGSQMKDLQIFSSPSLAVCCAEFSDPTNELPQWMRPFIKENNHVNLKAALKWELLQNGVQEENIEINPICTCCSNKWPSFRENKTEKRIANIIWLKS